MVAKIVKILFWILFGLLTLTSACAGCFFASFQEVSNPYVYEWLSRPRLGSSRLIDHFPKKIPEGAQEIRFFYQQGFMQGGDSVQLHLTLPPEKIKDIWDEYAPQAKEKLPANTDAFPPIGDRTSAPDIRELYFPERFTLLVLGARPYEPEGSDFAWNHGETFGLAISPGSSEVIYWAESW